MNFSLSSLTKLILPLTLVFALGCEKELEDDLASTIPFTPDMIDKTWKTGCTAGTDIISSSTHYKLELDLDANGTFSTTQYWYPTSACSFGGYTAIYNTDGTYALDSSITNGVQGVTFTVTASEIMPAGTQVQTDMNTKCGNSSPFDAGGASSGNNGGHFSTYMITCFSGSFPNSSNKTVTNVFSFDGTTLSMGAPYFGVPGIFGTSGTPTEATISLY